MTTEGRNEVIRFIESVGHGWFGSAQSQGRLEEVSPPPRSELVAEALDAVLEHLQMIFVDAEVVELLRQHDSVLAVRRQGNGMAQTVLGRQNILRRMIPQVEEDNSMLRSIGDQQPAVGEPGDPRRVDQRTDDVLLLRLAALKLGAELVQQVTAGVVKVDGALAPVGDCSYLVLLVPGDVRWFLEVTLELTNDATVRLEDPHGRLSSNLKHAISDTVQWTGKPVKTLSALECIRTTDMKLLLQMC